MSGDEECRVEEASQPCLQSERDKCAMQIAIETDMAGRPKTRFRLARLATMRKAEFVAWMGAKEIRIV